MFRYRPVLTVGTALVLLTPSAVWAQQFGGVLTLQSSSSLTAGGLALGVPVTQQGAGSLVTTYSGTIGITSANLSTLQLTFSNTTNLVAANSGSWQPLSGGGAGSAPANYGGLIDFGVLGGVRFAVRNLTATISTLTPITLTPTGGGTYSFPANQTLTLTGTSVLDYQGFGIVGGQVGAGTESLANESGTNAGGNGTLQDLGGGNFTLTYPVAMTINEEFGGEPATITLTGTMIAQGTLVPVPEPAGVLAVCAAVLVAGYRVRRVRAQRQTAGVTSA